LFSFASLREIFSRGAAKAAKKEKNTYLLQGTHMNTKHTLKYAEEPSLDDLFVARKFNEFMLEAKTSPVSRMLFGRMWLEGEMAVLMGEAGVGKSIMAVQIAEAIAGGQAFAPFEMTGKPQKVLYMNLKMSSKQFLMRYSAEHDADDGDTFKDQHKFPDNMIRVDVNVHRKLPEGYRSWDEVLAPLIHRLVKKEKAKVVIIDNITMLQRSVYGYRETFTIMNALDKLKRRLGISILVLARSSKYGSTSAASNTALLSRFADSIFMIGKSKLDPSARFLKQIFARSSEMVYDESHVASFCIRRIDGNRLGLVHYGFGPESEHKHAINDDRLYPTIDKVKNLSDEGRSIREIAADMDLPKTTVHRYLQMWTAEIGAAMKERTPQPYDPTTSEYYFPGREEYDEAKNDPKFRLLLDPSIPDDDPRYRLLMREYSIIDNACARARQIYKKTGITPKLGEDAEYAEFMKAVSEQCQSKNAQQRQPQINADEADKSKNISPISASSVSSAVNEHNPPVTTKDPESAGLKHTLNEYGRDIWIEEVDDYTGKPKVWYSYDSNGRKQKHTRNSLGINITRGEDIDEMDLKL